MLAPQEGEMGVGLRCRGVLQKRPLWPFGNRDALLEKARVTAEAFAEEAGVRPCLETVPEPGRLRIFLYPGEEPIQLARLESGGLMCTAKTSTIGPGYHRLVVELMDRLGEELGLRWAWLGDETCEGDETGYGEHRDFDQLQQYMTVFLRRLCGLLLTHLPRRSTILTGLSPKLGMPPLPGVISRLGVRPPALIREIAEGPEAGLAVHAADWFPWWDEALTARAWRNLGLGLMWVELRWAPPADETERRLYALALHALDRAGALDPELDLPAREMAEIRTLLDPAVDPFRLPAPDGIGYRRGPLQIDIGDGWSLEAPGYFWRRVVDGGFSLALGHRPRLILATTLDFELRPGATLDEPDKPLGPDEFRFDAGGRTGRAELNLGEGAGGAPGTRLRATIAGPRGKALVSVGFKDEADLAWAKALLESVRYEPPAE